MAMVRALCLLPSFFGGIDALALHNANLFGSAAHNELTAPKVVQVVSAAREHLVVLNTTVDAAITLLTTANTTGCDLLSSASSGLDALAPMLTQMDTAAQAIASLPFSSSNADEVKAKVSSFVESVTAQMESSDVSLAGGCGSLSAVLTPLTGKVKSLLDVVYAQYSAALDQVGALAPETTLMRAEAKFWPFTNAKPANKYASAESAVKTANASVAAIDKQLIGVNSTIVEAMGDLMDVITSALTQFQDSCLQQVSALPSTLSSKAGELCTKSTDVEETISVGMQKIASIIPTAVARARTALANAYTVSDDLLTAIDDAEAAGADAAAAS